MAEPTIQLGGGNWAGKTDNLLGYYKEGERFYKQDFTFSRSTTGTYTDKDGYIQTSAINIPRVDYLNNSNGSLILEPQRSNLIPYSEDFTQSYWAKANIAVTSNNAISPDGTLNADKLFETTGNGVHILVNNAITTNGLVTGSIYSKYLSRYLRLTIHNSNNANEWYSVIYDLENGTIYDELAKTVTVFNCEIEQMPNDYYRCIITADLGLTSSTIFYIQTSNGASINLGDNRGRGQYQGDGTSGIYIWGAQVEQGSYPTSYIPTSGSSVTRNADACSITNVADRINSSEGVLYAEINSLVEDDTVFKGISLNDGSVSNLVLIYVTNFLNTIRAVVQSDGVSVFVQDYVVSSLKDFNKIAIKYKANDFALWVNGVEQGTSTSGNAPIGLDSLDFDEGTGTEKFYGNCKDLRVYNTALTNSELATLTTL